MTLKSQKIICCLLIALVVVGGFEALIYILNLNQPAIYLQTAFWIFAYLVFEIVFLHDLHVKTSGHLSRARLEHARVKQKPLRFIKVLGSAFYGRFHHLRKWGYIKQWLGFLLLPSFIFWSTISLFYVNFGDVKVQQLLALFSSLALILDYWFLKEAFLRGREVADNDIFVVLSMIKIYAAAMLYAAALSILRYYCLNPWYFTAEVFCFTFLLVYQALYHHRRAGIKNISVALGIAAIMAAAGFMVYIWWGYNYFTAAVFLAALYNLMWGVFHYRLDKALTWHAFWEILLVSIIVSGMVFSVTNFKARISDECQYYLDF